MFKRNASSKCSYSITYKIVPDRQIVLSQLKIGEVDLDAVKAAGYDTTVMVVITNTPSYNEVARVEATDVKHGDNLISLTAH